MLRPFLEQRLYQTSTPAKLAEYWQARVSTRGNDLSERVILAGNALPASHPNRFHGRTSPRPTGQSPKRQVGTDCAAARREEAGHVAPAIRHRNIPPPIRPTPDTRAAKSDAGTLPLRQQPAPRHLAPAALSRRPTRRHAVNPARVPTSTLPRLAVKKTAPPDGGALIISQ